MQPQVGTIEPEGARLEPTLVAVRIMGIDALRGFALFSILIANLLVFTYPFPYSR